MTEYTTIETESNGNGLKMIIPKDHTNCYLYQGGYTCDGGQMYGFEICQPQPGPTGFDNLIVVMGYLFFVMIIVFLITTVFVAWDTKWNHHGLKEKVTSLEDEVRDLENELDEKDRQSS